MNINTGGPAFPTYAGADWDKDPRDPNKDDPRNKILGGGMTLRDWFAGLAMQGLIAKRGTSYWKDTPAIAYTMADALLAERQKGGDA